MNFIKVYYIFSGGVHTPRKLLNQLTIKWPQFSGGDQHDSHELLRHLLESVKSEDLRRYQKVVLTSLGYKTNTVPASVEDEIKQKIKFYGGQAQDRILRPEQVFRGFLVSTLACQECQNTSSRHENFLDISLPVSVGKPQPPRRKTSPEPATISKHQMKKDKEKERKMKKQQKHASKKNILVLNADGGEKTTENIDSNIVNLHNEENGLSSESDCSKESDADVEDNLLDDLPKTISAENRYPVDYFNGNVKSPVNPEKLDDTPENPYKDQESNKIPIIQINDNDNGEEVSTSDFVREENEKNSLNNVVVELAISAHGCANLVKEFSDINIEEEKNKRKENRRTRTYSHADWSTTIAPRYQCEEGECSVQSCLSNFTASELMTDNNKVGCDKCTERINGKDGKTINTNATKQFLISNPPAVLILHLKRFQVGPRCMFRKLARHVSFPMTLDIASFCGSKVKNLPNIQRHQKKLMYSLYGVVEHSGGMHGGHYVAYVKVRPQISKDDPRWKHLPEGSKAELDRADEQKARMEEALLQKNDSDDSVDEINEEELGAVGGSDEPVITAPPGKWYYVSDSRVTESSEEIVKNVEAYLLFYERIY